jgi:hypothetical protein
MESSVGFKIVGKAKTLLEMCLQMLQRCWIPIGCSDYHCNSFVRTHHIQNNDQIQQQRHWCTYTVTDQCNQCLSGQLRPHLHYFKSADVPVE